MKLSFFQAWCRTIAATAITTAVLTGCAGRRATTPDVQVAATPQEQFDALASRLGDWNELSTSVKVELLSPKKMTVSGKAYMHRGKDISISLRMLGIEVASLYADSDSVFITDKFNKRYIAEDISSLLGGTDVTLSDIQDILLGRPFVNGKGTVSSASVSDLTLASTDSTLIITPRKTIKGASYSFIIKRADNTPASFDVTLPSRKFSMLYSDAANTAAGLMMNTDRITVSLGKTNLDIRLNWNFGNAEWEINRSVKKPKISKSYKRIIASDFLKNFKI